MANRLPLTARRGLVPAVLAALALAGVLGVSLAQGEKGVGRSAAARAALRALGVSGHTGAEIVFALPSPIPGGSVVRTGGPSAPASSGQPVSARAATVARAGHAAWFFYEDLAPFQQYTHPGRVALVDARTGRVTLSAVISWPPSVNGRLPAFLSSIAAYESAASRVFYRPYTGADTLAPASALLRSLDATHPALDSAAAGRLGSLLAAEHACVVRATDSLRGGYYGYAWIAQSRAALGYRFIQLAAHAPGLHTFIYSDLSAASSSLTAFVDRKVVQYGCKDVLLYVAGNGYDSGTAVNLGMALTGGRTFHQDLDAGALGRMIASHRDVDFTLVLDAPHTSGFRQLGSQPNVLEVATPVAAGGGSFTYLPEALVGGGLIPNDTNPLRLLQFTDRLVFGLDTVVGDSCEMSAAASLAQSGKLPSLLAYLTARGFDRGRAVDWVARSGVGSPPDVRIHGFTPTFSCPTPTPTPTPTPVTPVVTAAADAYPATNASALAVAAAQGVLANDSDSAHLPLTVDRLNGTPGSAPFTATTGKGATVTLNADGSFSYDPTGSATLQALPRGQTTTDTFTYRATDNGHGGMATATVTITVTGAVNHPPVASADAYAAGNGAVLTKSAATGVLANDTDADGDALVVDQLNGSGGSAPFTATTGKGASVTLGADGSLSYDPTGSATLQALGHGQTATDTFTYRASDGHGGTSTATVTITVTGADRPPVTTADAYPAASNAVLSENAASGVLANDTDPDSDALVVDQLNGSATLTGTSVKGAAVTVNADGSFSYDPTGSATLQALARGATTTDTFTYRANDGHGGTATATVTITVTGAVNHPPVASADAYPAASNAALTENAAAGVLANDTDADGDALVVDQLNGSATLTGTSVKGAAVTVNADGSFSYDPTGSATLQAVPRGATTTDTFTYRANDGNGGTATATVTITVTGAVNHAPVANADAYAAGNDAVVTANAASGVLANDTDADSDALAVDQLNGSATLTGTSTKGAAVTLNADGSFSYDATGSATLQALARGATTTDTFTYRASDGNGGTATATVTITVTGAVNHAPVATADSYAIDSNAVLSKNAASGVLANDTDADSDALVVDQLNGSGGLAPFTGSSTKGAAVTLNADGSFGYDPTGSATLQALARGATTTDTFTYRASDGNGGTATATVTITVTGVNHPPVANADSYTANNNATLTENAAAGVLANDTDADSDTLAVDKLNGTGGAAPFAGTSTKGASVTLNADGSFSYDPTSAAALHPPQLAIGSSTADTFTYEVSDGHGGTATATATITVTAVDTPPNAPDFTVTGGAVGNTLLEVGTVASPSSEPKLTQSTDGILGHASDPDTGDSVTVTSVDATSAQGGNVSADTATGGFAYRPKAGFTGSDSFQYTVTDTHGQSATGTITVNVANMVWYVQNNAAGAHDGRSGSPFNTLAGAQTASGSGDVIYVFRGDGTSTNENAGITLKASQTLLSDKYDLVIGAHTLASGTGTNRAVIGNSAGDGVTLAAGNTVKGFDNPGTGAGKFAIAGGSGDASGTIADDVLHGATSAGGLTLNGTSGTWAVSDMTATGTGGAAFDASAAGTVNFTGTDSLTGTGAGAFKNAGATTYSGTIGTTSSTGGAANGIDVSGAAGSITFNGGTLSGTTTNALLATGGSANVTYSGTESNSAGHSVNISGRSSGTVTVQSTINDTGTGISLTSNTGATIAFTGTITASTGASAAFTATGGGTVSATGTGSTLTTTTGTALDVANTTIGASGLTFRSISANGAVNGIVLDHTGSSGGLTVAGNAGTCTSTGSTCTGGTIQNTTGSAVTLTSTQSPAFNFMKITNVALSGISGTAVTNFTLADSVIDGVNTSHTATDSDLAFNVNGGGATENNLSGTVSITNNHLNNSYAFGIDIYNYSGTISSLTITGNSLTSNTSSTLSLDSAINVFADRSASNHASITAGSISNNTIQNFPAGAGIQVVGGNTAAGQAVAIASNGSPFLIEDNTITGAGTGSAGLGTNGIQVTAGESTTAYFTIGQSGHPNTITDVRGNGIACSLFGVGTEKCTIAFNSIDANNTAGSPGINTGADQAAASGASGVGTLYLDIHNNTVQHTTGNGILSTVRSVSSTGIFHIENNSISQPTVSSGTVYGIRADSGNSTGGTPTVCLKIDGNTTAGSTNGSITAPGIGLRQEHAATTAIFQIQGLAPSPADDAQMEAYVGNAGQNPASANGTFGATGAASISGGATFTAATCTIP